MTSFIIRILEIKIENISTITKMEIKFFFQQLNFRVSNFFYGKIEIKKRE